MPPAKLRFLAVPDFRAKGVAGARVAPMSVAAVQPGIDGKLSNARTLLLLDTAGKEFPSSGVSFREALETCVPSDAHPDPRDMAATENFMIEDEVDDLATAYDAAVVDADLLPLTLPPPSIRSNHDDVKSFLLSALEREDATAGTGLRIADLDLVEAPIVSRASVFDDDSTLAAPTGARLALELEKHFRGEGGWLPTNSPSPPPRSELFAPLNPRDRDRAARASTEREMRAPFDARVRRALAAVDRADFTPPDRTTTSSSIRFESSRFPSSSRTLTHRRSHRPNPSSFSRRAWGSSRCPCRAWTSRGRRTPSPPRKPRSTAVNSSP